MELKDTKMLICNAILDNEQCNMCMHKNVCAYKKQYEAALKLCGKVAAECENNPYFKFRVECVQYRSINISIIGKNI